MQQNEQPLWVLVNTKVFGICFKCDTAFKPGDEIQQVTISVASDCEHKAAIRNLHKACLEKSNG
jgi:hypothetical protein